MTPLAHRIVKELTLPLKDRTFKDQCGLLQRMDDVHCFDVTEVFNLAADLALSIHDTCARMGELKLMETQTFLPAPSTWIEWSNGGGREAVLLEYDARGQIATSRWAFGDSARFLSARKAGVLSLTGDGVHAASNWPAVRCFDGEGETEARGWNYMVLALLAIINSPRLIGRKQHMPHRGLERRLANAKGLVGKFPLHAWTELKLSVSDIGKRADGTEHEAHYTGEKCLHFCRAHLRIRNGKLERVQAHWRGNPALGIKRTRYKVAA